MRVIRQFMETTFSGLIDMADCDKSTDADRESAFLSRALAAYSVMVLAGATPEEAASSVTDGYGDNGIDAIYCDESDRILYVVQSKWSHAGSDTITRGDAQKFIKGFKDLIHPRFERFNAKVQVLAPIVNDALDDARTRIYLVPVYTGQQPLSDEVASDFKDLMAEINDPTEVVSIKPLRQVDIYGAISRGSAASPIDLDVVLYEWAQVREPHRAFYGQVSASDLAQWFVDYHPELFAPNIRYFLGETDVNQSLQTTLKCAPEDFWFFNNGVTALCSSITKKAIGGSSRDSGTFECKDLQIVNGAQTVGSIAATAPTHPDEVGRARVPIRLISLEDCPETFGQSITRTNNTQNRIDARDFVALDPHQERLKTELHLVGISYAYKSGEAVASDSVGFDLVEASVARACAQPDIAQTVQAKREIGRLWDDINKPPYQLLFNGSVTGLNLWKHVQILRAIDAALKKAQKSLSGRSRMYAVHGNRFIAHLVYSKHPVGPDAEYAELSEAEKAEIGSDVDAALVQLESAADRLYPDSYLASLFKNLSKCRAIEDDLKASAAVV
jgi:hypothetical protein